MPRLRAPRGLLVRHGLLIETGERVVFAEDADHGSAATGFRAERRRDVGDAVGDLEPGLLELVLKERRALGLLIADLGQLPDLMGQRRIVIGLSINPPLHFRTILLCDLTASDAGRREDEE